MANFCEASRNSLSNTPIKLETARQRHRCSRSTQAIPPGLSKAFEILQIALRSVDGRIHKPIYPSWCTTGCAAIGRESGFLYWIMLMMLASSSRLKAPVRMGTRTAAEVRRYDRLWNISYNARIDQIL